MAQRVVVYLVCGLIILFLSASVFSDCPTADLSGDCIVDMSDMLLFAEYWLSL